jgi:hypothetical protein
MQLHVVTVLSRIQVLHQQDFAVLYLVLKSSIELEIGSIALSPIFCSLLIKISSGGNASNGFFNIEGLNRTNASRSIE